MLFAGRVWLIPAHFSTDPNEGWNAFQAARAISAGVLYPPPGSLTGNNYPPLSFFIVGGIGRVIGDAIVAGRLIALVSVLIVAGLVFAAVRLVGGRSAVAPVLGTLLFLGCNATILRPYLAMDDPQWLGHALMTAGIVLLLAGETHAPLRPGRIASAALLVVCGGLVKHNLVAFPLAATLWLMLYDRRALAVWIATSALTLLATVSLLDHAYGAAFFADLLTSDRHYSALRMVVKSVGPVAVMLPMILVTLRLRRIRGLDPRIDLLLLMVVISVPLGIVQRSGQGVDRNAHFEAFIALSIATAASLGRCGFAMQKPRLLRPLPWLIVPFLLLLPGATLADFRDLVHQSDRQVAWTVLQDRIATIPGPVACETLALCYWAGKSFELDFFLYGQQVAVQHDAAALTQALVNCRFMAIELNRRRDRPLGEVRNPMRALISRYYHPVFVDKGGYQLLMPASCPTAPATMRR
ncbi:hypothetical protein [Lichenicoccus sp.]|uniref:hypothetical protein n=1 Tax=Lichenicoccus sp. TaxID=2781899 RepID=UPI003D0C8D5A